MVKAIRRTKRICAKFLRKILIIYNRCQTYAKRRLEEFPDHEGFLKQLQVICLEDEQSIQLVKGLDEKVLKTAIAQAAVGGHLLEDLLWLIPSRVANMRSQTAKHEITIRFLKPFGFESIASKANVWNKFMNNQIGSY